VYLFLESLTAGDDYFWGFPCPELDDFENDFLHGDCFKCDVDGSGKGKCNRMGLDAIKYDRGSFYLLTHGEDPAVPGIPPLAGDNH
jgi:hypothetical protein